MPKRIIQLSDTKVRNAKPRKNEYKLFDGAGLFLSVTPSGGKLWYLKYRFDGKEKKLSLGSYPEIDLATARTRKEEARRQVANGVDPGEVRKAMKQAEAAEAETFEVIAREWHRKFKPTWTPSHAVMILGRLEYDLFPYLGKRPINEIKAPELLAVLRRAESRGALYTAHRLRTIAG
jgi:hypothetical protein